MKEAKFSTWYEIEGKAHRAYYKTEAEAQQALEVLAKEFAKKKPGGEYDVDLDFNWATVDYADGSHQLIVIEDLGFKKRQYQKRLELYGFTV